MEERVLITLDRGVGEIRAYPPGSHARIVSPPTSGAQAFVALVNQTHPLGWQ